MPCSEQTVMFRANHTAAQQIDTAACASKQLFHTAHAHTYLAHHERESLIIVINIVITWHDEEGAPHLDQGCWGTPCSLPEYCLQAPDLLSWQQHVP